MAPESKPPIARIAATSSCPPIEIYAAPEKRAVSPPCPRLKHRILETIELSAGEFTPCSISTSQRLMHLGKLLVALCPEKERIPLKVHKKDIFVGERKIGNVLKPGISIERIRIWADLYFPAQEPQKGASKMPLQSLLPITVLPLHFKADYTKIAIYSSIAKFAAITYHAEKEKAFLEFYISKRSPPIASFEQA